MRRNQPLENSLSGESRRRQLVTWLVGGGYQLGRWLNGVKRSFVAAVPRHRSTVRRLGRDAFGCFEHLEPRVVLTTIDLAALTAAQGSTIFGADVGDQSGLSLSSAGDVNGDGFDDVLIGAFFADAASNAKLSAGDSYLIFGGVLLPPTIDLANLGTAGVIIHGAEGIDLSGRSVSSAGDVSNGREITV